MILDVHWCIGALVQKHKTRTPWACRGMQGAQRNHGQSKAGTTSFAGQRSNVATACNCYFFLGGIRKLISALKVLDVLKRLGQDHLYTSKKLRRLRYVKLEEMRACQLCILLKLLEICETVSSRWFSSGGLMQRLTPRKLNWWRLVPKPIGFY